MFDDNTGLQLPFDSLKSPGVETRLAAVTFELPPAAAGAEGVDVLAAAAFGIQLARYTGQSSIPVITAAISQERQLRWIDRTQLETGPAATGGQLVRHLLAHYASEHDSAASSIVLHPAALILAEGASLRDSEEALALMRGLPASAHAGVDLYLVVAVGGGESRAAYVYNSILFRADTIGRFVGHLQTLLTEFAAQLNLPIAQLRMISASEERIIRSLGEGSVRPYAGIPVHCLIEQNAAETPDAIAIRFRDQSLSYAELNRQANRLGAYLTAQGLGAECRVVVCVEGGFEIMVALLAILKAGAVYVPLDPTYPEVRIRAILEDTQPGLVISRSHLIEKLSLSGFPVFRMDTDAEQLSAYSAENAGKSIALDRTAYIYYTSGTTGKPKGVMASHRNLIHYILTAQRRYGFNRNDVMPAIARFSFSISMFELMSPLAAGGTLILLERDHVVDPARMSQTLQEVTFFHAGPSLLRVVLAYIRHRFTDFQAFAKVRHASSGGDMVAPELLESLKQVFANAEVFVIYGCSEISCMGCTYPAPRERTLTRSFVGSPLENVVVRIFDAQRKPAPFGIVGEICFAGGGVVKGYLNRNELTVEKFIEVEGRRFYCTGDMGRINPAGEVEILGRRDFQIQLRGMRIELGEIEYALRKAPGVSNGVVMAWTDASGEKSLAAYVVFQPDHSSSIATVRQHMLDSLPDYMIPSFYVELAALPLNHNMKVDRYALPSPQASDRRASATVQVRAAETATEKQLIEIWKSLLGVEEIGLDDNFVELGGHSMLLMQLILEVERRLGVALEGTEILEEPLEVLASLIDIQLGRPGKDLRGRSADRVKREEISQGADATDSPSGVFMRLSAGHAFLEDIRRHSRAQNLTLLKSLKIVRADYGVQALLAYRLGRSLLRTGRKPYLWPLLIPGWPLYFLISRYVRLAFDIRLSLSADIGPGLYIGHFGGISLQRCQLGKQCSISQSVRIGPRGDSTGGPVLGNRVWVGAHSTIIGPYRVGNGSTVSAAATLQRDIPENTLCMGNPARVVMRDYDNTAILDL